LCHDEQDHSVDHARIRNHTAVDVLFTCHHLLANLGHKIEVLRTKELDEVIGKSICFQVRLVIRQNFGISNVL
jgi:hypothetical protein